ncbi:MAG: hypothetical protein HY901_32890, partial [Deltaproteobacteria bacterium]|nr:hypothetical protein [Deltaproteobacteria bacterium]
MKRRATRRACVLAALLVSIGCFHDEVPSGTRVACHGDDDCPPGFLCRPGVEMCVVRGQMDDAPPSLSGPVSITPALAKAGDTLLVELKASEPLLIDPRVRVGTEEVPLDEPGTDRARLTYRFARRVIGVEPEDSPLPVTVDLLDAAGNAANGLAAGSARFDFTLPKVLSSSEVEPLAARRGVSARVSFSVSEAVGQAPVVTMAPPSGAGSERAWVKTEPDASGSFAYRYTVQGDEEEGLWFVSVTAVDLAGNLSRPTVVGQVALDFTAPGVPDLQRVEVSPPAAAVGRTVMVEVAASETVQSSARLYAGSIAFAAPQAREHVLTFLHTVEGDEDGVWALRLEGLEDLAGNVADPIAVGEVTLDGTPPAILDLAIAPTRASAVAGHEVVVASFALSESPASLDVRLGNRPMSCVVSPASLGAQATCRYQVSGNEVEGGQIVSVLALDAAGNAGIASARVELDFTAPSPLPDADVRLIAPSGCPLQDVIRLGAGATLRVLFSTDEAAIDPLVRTRSPEELDFTRAWGTTTFFEFRHTLSTAAHAQGRYEVEVVLEDAVGNRSASALGLREPGFVVDTESPAAPQVNQAGLLVFHREPWDTADSQGQVRMRLLAAAGAAEAEATLIAYGGSPEAELGRAQTEADGSAELILVAGDRPRIRVASVDAACNASGKVLVREGEWVASMGGKVAGSTVENPNRLVSRAWMGPVSAPVGPAVGAPALGGTTMAALDGQAALQAGEPAYFVHRFSTCPPATLRSTLAFDDARGRLVLFGGLDSGNTAYGVVFEHGVTEWRPAATADPEGDGDPSPRYGQAVAYDDARGQLVMFGGYEGATFSDQTWGWDGTSWRRMGASLHPAGAYAAAMAYDRTRRKVVLLGGAVGLSDDSGETWEWDGASWQRVEPLDPEGDGNPAARSEHAMAWDGGRGRVLLLGGHQILGSIDPTSLGDQWEWDGASWKRVIPLDPEG